ncbi:fimbrial protein HofO [Citrobacter amalonaticus]|nr:fimbrial protein HofO [Citrobacter amalonaticus]
MIALFDAWCAFSPRTRIVCWVSWVAALSTIALSFLFFPGMRDEGALSPATGGQPPAQFNVVSPLWRAGRGTAFIGIANAGVFTAHASGAEYAATVLASIGAGRRTCGEGALGGDGVIVRIPGGARHVRECIFAESRKRRASVDAQAGVSP